MTTKEAQKKCLLANRFNIYSRPNLFLSSVEYIVFETSTTLMWQDENITNMDKWEDAISVCRNFGDCQILMNFNP
jgi:hypothetical protein